MSAKSVIGSCHAVQCGALTTKECGACNTVFYCSKECQKKDWPLHKESCKGIQCLSHTIEQVKEMLAAKDKCCHDHECKDQRAHEVRRRLSEKLRAKQVE